MKSHATTPNEEKMKLLKKMGYKDKHNDKRKGNFFENSLYSSVDASRNRKIPGLLMRTTEVETFYR
jgi:hypothetical protein